MPTLDRRRFIGLTAAGAAGLAAATLLPGAAVAATVGPVPQAVVDRYRLDTQWYRKYIDAYGIPLLGSAAIQDSTLLRAYNQLGTLYRTNPYSPVGELDRRNVRVVLTARGERMSSIPEVRAAYGTTLDTRYWGGMGATDSLPLSVGTEANLMDNQGSENVFVHEMSHTIHLMSLRHIDTSMPSELNAAWNNARSRGLWNNTYAATNQEEYFAEGAQSYFNVNRSGPIGGDGVHNHINTRSELASYDAPLYNLLNRIYRGANLDPGRLRPAELGKVSSRRRWWSRDHAFGDELQQHQRVIDAGIERHGAAHISPSSAGLSTVR